MRRLSRNELNCEVWAGNSIPGDLKNSLTHDCPCLNTRTSINLLPFHFKCCKKDGFKLALVLEVTT